jgi:hypothetical protein
MPGVPGKGAGVNRMTALIALSLFGKCVRETDTEIVAETDISKSFCGITTA